MNFRKPTVLLLALTMMLSNIGLAVSIHYCCGNLSSIGVHKEPKKVSACCAKLSNDKKCCSEKVIRFKDGCDRLADKIFSTNPVNLLFFEQQFSSYIVKKNVVRQKSDSFTYHCPNTGPPLFKLQCQFIFYA